MRAAASFSLPMYPLPPACAVPPMPFVSTATASAPTAGAAAAAAPMLNTPSSELDESSGDHDSLHQNSSTDLVVDDQDDEVNNNSSSKCLRPPGV